MRAPVIILSMITLRMIATIIIRIIVIEGMGMMHTVTTSCLGMVKIMIITIIMIIGCCWIKANATTVPTWPRWGRQSGGTHVTSRRSTPQGSPTTRTVSRTGRNS